MSTKFTEVIIQNNNSVDIEISLEIPAGSLIITENIGANSKKSIPIDKTNVQSTKFIVKASGHSNYPDNMLVDLSRSGMPYGMYIEKIDAVAIIGSIHGNVSVKF